jgi:hypothetical protein
MAIVTTIVTISTYLQCGDETLVSQGFRTLWRE